MILELKGIFKNYQQGKMSVPVLKDVIFPWKRENMWQSWDHPDQEKQHS